MAIPISVNFDLSAGLPIDSKVVQATTASRNAIPLYQRYEGMVVYVGANEINYQLVGGIADINWQPFSAQSASYALTADTASYIDAVNVIGVVATASYAFTSSYETTVEISSSWASASLSSSYVPNLYPQVTQVTVASASWVSASAHIITSDTASFIAASNIVGTITSASYSQTASYSLNAGYATQSIYALSASWVSASAFITTAQTASYVPNLYPQTYQVSGSWASASLSSSYSLTSSYALNISPADTASYATFAQSASYAESSSIATTASYAKNAQVIIDFDWHLVRNSNTNIQTTHNFVPGSTRISRNGMSLTADYITTEYDYVESGSNQIQLHFTMSTETNMMAVYTLQQ